MVEPQRVVTICFPVFLGCAATTVLLGLFAIWFGELHEALTKLGWSAGLLMVVTGLVLSGCRVVGAGAATRE